MSPRPARSTNARPVHCNAAVAIRSRDSRWRSRLDVRRVARPPVSRLKSDDAVASVPLHRCPPIGRLVRAEGGHRSVPASGALSEQKTTRVEFVASSLIGGSKLALPFHARTGQSEDKPRKEGPRQRGPSTFQVFPTRRRPPMRIDSRGRCALALSAYGVRVSGATNVPR